MSSSPNSIGGTDRQLHRSGKSTKVNKEVHPQTQPKWRREEYLAQAADSFIRQPSAVTKMESHDVPDNKIRGKAKIFSTEQFAEKCSPKTHRDKVIAEENEKFSTKSTITSAQQIGEKDRASPARQVGKSKTIVRDVHPDVSPRIPNDEARTAESQKFASHVQDGALAKIGDADHSLTCRKRVVGAARPDTLNLSNMKQAPHTIKVRQAHSQDVMATYEQVISAREESRQKVVDSQAKKSFLGGFSESDAKPYVFAHKQIPHNESRGKIPNDSAIAGFPGLGSKSGEQPKGRSHFDAAHIDRNQKTMASSQYENNNNSNSNNNNKKNNAKNGNEATSVAQELHKAKYEKTFDSKRVSDTMSHPDHRPFSAKRDNRGQTIKKVATRVEDNKAPDWWKGDSRSDKQVSPAYEKPGRKVMRQTGASTPSWWPGS